MAPFFAAIGSVFHLLGRAVSLQLLGMSTTALALGVWLLVMLIGLRRAYRAGGWRAIKTEALSDAGISTAVSIVQWVLVFVFIMIPLALYQDHRGLVGAVSVVKRDLAGCTITTQRIARESSSAISELRLADARKSGMVEALSTQNRDQQGTINGCLAQAMKLLTPSELKLTPLLLETVNAPDNPAQKASRLLMIVNKAVMPVRMVVACDLAIAQARLLPIGSGATLDPRSSRLAPNAFELGVGSPALSPTAPFLLTIVHDNPNIRCEFQIK